MGMRERGKKKADSSLRRAASPVKERQIHHCSVLPAQ
jgi:hypothetical protein